MVMQVSISKLAAEVCRIWCRPSSRVSDSANSIVPPFILMNAKQNRIHDDSNERLRPIRRLK